MYSPDAIRNIIRISLQPITATRHPLWTEDAEGLLLMIAAHESHLGLMLRQGDMGPARGVWQVEPRTMYDNYLHFIDARPKLRDQITDISGCSNPSDLQLQFNQIFNCIMARLKLYRSPGKLPQKDNALAMAEYAKLYYNSPLGAATAQKYLEDYERYVLQWQLLPQ